MISHGRYHTIATVFNPNFTKEGNSANAALIAVAPELFEVLRKAIHALNTAPRFKVEVLDTDSYAIVAECDRAIRRATEGGAA